MSSAFQEDINSSLNGLAALFDLCVEPQLRSLRVAIRYKVMSFAVFIGLAIEEVIRHVLEVGVTRRIARSATSRSQVDATSSRSTGPTADRMANGFAQIPVRELVNNFE